MRFALSLALLSWLVGTPARALCGSIDDCRRDVQELQRELDDGPPRVRGAIARLGRLDLALERGCGLGDADACRERIRLHVARNETGRPGEAAVYDSTSGHVSYVTDPNFTPTRSRAVIRSAYRRLLELERERVVRADSLDAYRAFVDEFPRDASVESFRRRIAELGLGEAVAASRAQTDLSPLFAFRVRVGHDELVEPALFEELVARGTEDDAERYLALYASGGVAPLEHVDSIRDRLHTLAFANAESRIAGGDVRPLIDVVVRFPTSVQTQSAIERALAGPLPADARADDAYVALAPVLSSLASTARPRAFELLVALLERMPLERRARRSVPLHAAVGAELRGRIVAALVRDREAGASPEPLFAIVAAGSAGPLAEGALVAAVIERGGRAELVRYLDLAPSSTDEQHRATVAARLRDLAIDEALAASAGEGIAPLLAAIVADPRHPRVGELSSRIVALVRLESATDAFDQLAPQLSRVPATVREELADAAVELLVHMGTRDRFARFAEASGHASLRQRQRLAEILRAEITVADGVAGARLLREFADAFPGTAASREALRDAVARENAETARRDTERLRERASRFRR